MNETMEQLQEAVERAWEVIDPRMDGWTIQSTREPGCEERIMPIEARDALLAAHRRLVLAEAEALVRGLEQVRDLGAGGSAEYWLTEAADVIKTARETT